MALRTCSKCSLTFPLDRFEPMGGVGRNRLRGECRECRRAYNRARYARLKLTDPECVLCRQSVTEGQRERVARSRRYKVCTRCKGRKLLRHFRAKPRRKYGVSSWCKRCEYAWVKAYRVTLR